MVRTGVFYPGAGFQLGMISLIKKFTPRTVLVTVRVKRAAGWAFFLGQNRTPFLLFFKSLIIFCHPQCSLALIKKQ